MQILTYEDTLAAGITPESKVKFGSSVYKTLIPHTTELLKYMHTCRLITKLEWNRFSGRIYAINEALESSMKVTSLKSFAIPCGINSYLQLLQYSIEFICNVSLSYSMKVELIERFKVWLTPRYETGA